MKEFTAIAAALVLAGCASLQLDQQPSRQSDWDRTLGYAVQNANSGKYFAAERVLDEFVRTHPGTREAREIGFWKAVYLIDPANDSGSLAGGIAALDGYLADSSGMYRTEALVLRRTAVAAQGVAALAARADTVVKSTPATKDTVVVVSKSRDEEIASLRDQLAKSKDELAKVSAELDRIKKRLANPTK